MKVISKYLSVGVLSLVLLQGCSNGPLPLDNIAAIQKFDTDCLKLGMKKFGINGGNALSAVETRNYFAECFENSGYSYSATLHKVAQEGIDPSNPNYMAMVGTLLTPGTKAKRPEDVWSGQELQDAKAILKMVE